MPGNKYVTSGQTISFLTGSQSTVDNILAAGSGAIHGAFYLTQDSHRLYVGNEDTSLSPVNEGITFYDTYTKFSNDMATLTSTANGRKSLTGQFFYIESSTGMGDGYEAGVLTVYNGKQFVVLNKNTNTKISSFVLSVQEDDNNNDLIKGTITDSDGSIKNGYFEVVNGDGVAVSYGSTTATISGVSTSVPTITVAAKYSIGVVTESNTTKVKLSGVSDTSTNSSFEVKAGNWTGDTTTNVAVSNDNGALKISAKDTKIAAVSIANNSTAGFDISVRENYNNQTYTGTLSPHVSYGTGVSATTADFVNGTATLNVYTKGEIDNLLTDLNAMHYIGTWGPNTSSPSGADDINYNTPGEVHVFLGATEKNMQVGDVLLALTTMALGPTGNPIQTVYKGSLLIARGTEDNDPTSATYGYITPSTLTFDVVEATYDNDTHYRFVHDGDNQGIKLQTSNGTLTDTGVLIFTGGDITSDAAGTTTTDMIKVTKSYEGITGQSGAEKATITIKHKDVSRSNTTGTKVNQNRAGTGNNFEAKTSVNVITSITTNASGHVTAVETTAMDLYDTATYFPSNGTGNQVTTTVYNGTNSKKVGIIQNTIKLVNSQNQETSATGYTAITSKSLVITDDDTQMTQSGGSQAASGLNIEMVWGSFDPTS